MTSEELAAIKARAEAATPGPWEVGECNEVRAACPVVGFDRGTVDEMYVRHQECTYPNCQPIGMGDAPRGYRVFICETDNGAYGPLREDAEFIAHARTDVPALAEEVERLQKVADFHIGAHDIAERKREAYRRALTDACNALSREEWTRIADAHGIEFVENTTPMK